MKFAVMRIGMLLGALGLLAVIADQAKAGNVTGTYSLGSDPDNQATGSGTGPFQLTSGTSPFTYSFVNFTPDQSFTLGDLTNLTLDFDAQTGYSAGSPRVAINLPGTVQNPYKQLLIYFGAPNDPNDHSEAAVDAKSGVNLLSLTGNLVEIVGGPAPNQYKTYADALSISGFSSLKVTSFTVITDNGSASLTLNGISANAVPEPATLLSAGIAGALCLGFGLRRRKLAKLAS